MASVKAEYVSMWDGSSTKFFGAILPPFFPGMSGPSSIPKLPTERGAKNQAAPEIDRVAQDRKNPTSD